MGVPMTDTTETEWAETEFFMVTNEDGNVTGDEDRDTAIERMRDDYGGDILRVTRMTIKVPVPKEATATMVLPEDVSTPVEVNVEA